MATQVQFRGGTTSEHSTFTGVSREVTVDTTKKTVVVHDGSTAGGIPLAKESAVTSAAAITGGSINGTTVGASTASTGAFTTLSASSTVSGTGFSTYLASPPAIGGTTASTGRFTTVTASSLTSGRVTYAGASGLLSDSANFVFDGTNVGIGTSSPEDKLSVYGDSVNKIAAYVENNNAAGASGADKRLSLIMGGSTAFSITGWQNAGVIEATSTGGLWLGAYNGAIKFATGSSARTERMRIDTSGNVGIGTSSPAYRLDVRDGSGSTRTQITNTANAAAGAGVFFQVLNSGTQVSNSTIAINNTGDLRFFTGTSSDAERMRIDSSGNLLLGTTSSLSGAAKSISLNSTSDVEFSMGASGTKVVLHYADATQYISGTATAIPYIFRTNNTDRMRLDTSGNLLVNTTTGYTGKLRVDNASADGIGVQLTGSGGATFVANIANTNQNFAYWVYSGSAVGSINTNGSTTSYNITSDYRLKENVVPMTDALAKVTQLKPVTYRWKESGLDGQGFIAHELQAVVPDCVTGEKDAIDADGKPVYQQMDTSHLVATLVSAIQELKAEFDAYKATHP